MLCKCGCGKEFEPRRKTQQYYSRECQLRKPCATPAQAVIAQEIVVAQSTEQSKRYINKTDLATGATCPTAPVDNPAMESLTARELTARIQSYPGQSWIHSPEYAEQIDRLLSVPVSVLEADGYWIPTWTRKRAEAV